MKKIAFNKIKSFWALLPLMLLLVGCTNTETTEDGSISGRTLKLQVLMPVEEGTRVGLEEDYYSKDLNTSWRELDEVQILITQGNKHYEVGKVRVTNISANKKSGTISFELPSALNLEKSYSVYALCGIEGTMVGGNDSNWYPLCTMELQRNGLAYFDAPLYSKVDVNNNTIPKLQFTPLGTYEVLHVTNATNSMITFKHRGFDVERPWYYKKVVAYLMSGDNLDLMPDASVYGDNVSKELTIHPGTTEAFVSWYIPTGEKIKSAELKATVNGTALKSANKKSSGVTIETGHAYHMYATWDGTDLRFENGDTESEERLNQVIPEELRDQLDDYIPIYDGSNPPNVEGEYVISPMEMTYDSNNGFEVGHVFVDTYIKFFNQNMVNNTLDFQEQSGSSESTGKGCFISGEGDRFSVFFNTVGVTRYSYDINFKTALVISGIKSYYGLEDLYYAFIMVDKSSDPDTYIMEIGDFRVFKDGDGISYYSPWSNNAKKRVIRKGKLPQGIFDAKKR